MARPLIVLKFGGSVLRGEEDLIRAARECESWIDRGWNVVAVVSAFEGVTDQLVTKARSFGAAPVPEAQALLTATGELQSASLLTLALQRAGVRAAVGAPWSIGLRATCTTAEDGLSSGPLDAFPLSLNAAAVRVTLEEHRAIVVPGFVGIDELKRLVLLGRGGSDLSAIFIAEALGAAKCRLVKDVDGLYEWDPAKEGPPPKRFASVSWVHALTLDGGIVQHKAVRFARERRLRFEVGGYASVSPTIVGDVPVEFSESASLVACAG
jgi:homoserine dehydrogenase